MASVRKLIKRRRSKAGLPPGTPVYIGEKREDEVRVTILDYDEKGSQEKEITDIEDIFPYQQKPTVTWINVNGIHRVDLIEKIGRGFNLHPLTIEDIVNTDQRPKLEDHEKYLYIVFKMLTYDEKEDEVKTEQVSLICLENCVLSFQEREGDIFEAIRQRIRNNKGRICRMKADYLAYSLIDAVVDNYFLILEKLGERIEVLEESIVDNPKPESMQEIHHLKRGMLFLRKSVWPLREVISGLERGESPLIHKPTRVFLRDIYDHTIQVIDTVETFRDMLSGMHDTYLSSLSNRMNEIMKVLTIIATIFIPLTFIAGVYGMNFEYMPELAWRWSYFGVLALMAGVVVLMVVFFKKKKWL
ncbi:MAG: magnesium/cobalt transporter CorA [Acidobacteriota bacterium]